MVCHISRTKSNKMTHEVASHSSSLPIEDLGLGTSKLYRSKTITLSSRTLYEIESTREFL